jgi:3-oxoacyl-[acyl-carrier protein] reductase
MRLEEKVAIITGGGRGIGKAVALGFAKEGANIVIAEMDLEPANEVAEEIKVSKREAIAIKTDVSNPEDVEKMVNTALSTFGKIDILVNNAGVSVPAMLHKMDHEQWDRVINSHLKGTYNCIRSVVNHMIERKAGKIINVVSAAGVKGTIGQINYSAAKAGIIGITKSAARELGRYGINVNAIAPSAITRMTEKVYTNPKFKEKYLAAKAIKRFAQPEEMVPAFVFFASDDTNFITGQVLVADGGATI